jgi:hypothetical protein
VVRHRTRVLDACRILPPTAILGVPAFYERLERAAASGRIVALAAALGGGRLSFSPREACRSWKGMASPRPGP